MIRNFKRPIEPLIGTAGRVRKIGFSTRVSPKNERFHERGHDEGWTVINLSWPRGQNRRILSQRVENTVGKQRERKRKSSVGGRLLDENPRAMRPPLFAPQKPLEFSKLGRKISKAKYRSIAPSSRNLFSTPFQSHCHFLFEEGGDDNWKVCRFGKRETR